jgi:cyclopropane fatty-acyl-phospholipid synthase-like methyltransferase
MSDYAHAINQHYGQAELSAKLLIALREAGKDLDALTRDDLASFDEQHDGGRETTRELARLAGLREGMHVLDVGSGLGGPARTLAVECGCQVTGLDLTEVLSSC